MPAPHAISLVARAAPLPADLQLQLGTLKDRIEAIVDGAALPCDAARCVAVFKPILPLLSQQDLPVQAEDVRQGLAALSGAADIWDRIMIQSGPPPSADMDAFDHLVADAHDLVCGALEAELPIHVAATIEQAV